MKALMMIPAGLIGLMSFGHMSGPVKPTPNNIVISDTTGPGHSGHHKGNMNDSTGTNGGWKGKGKTRNQSGNSSGSGSGTGTTGTSSGGTGTTNQ